MIKRSLLILSLCPGLLYAATENTDAANAGWSGEGELGYTSTSGNTDSENLNARLGIGKESGKWKHTASLESIKTTTDNVTSADSVVFKEKTEYKLGEKAYVFGKLRYEEDEFSGFDYQGSIAFGFGSQFIKTDAHTLDASIGVGYRTLKDTATQEVTQEGILSGDAAYKFVISPSATFGQTFLFEAGDQNTHTESETSLKNRINSQLASKISYLVKNNTDVPVGTEKTDKILTVSLLYSF